MAGSFDARRGPSRAPDRRRDRDCGRRGPRAALVRAGLAVVLLLLGACGGEETLEDRVRRFIDEVADTAEDRDWRALGDFVADDYRDDRGLDKPQLVAVGVRYILANQRIFVLERVALVEVQGPGSAHARVYAAIAGRPMSGPQDLLRVTADIYRFDLDLRADADEVLRVHRLDWQAVAPREFLTGQ